jgi:alpha-galactosidase
MTPRANHRRRPGSIAGTGERWSRFHTSGTNQTNLNIRGFTLAKHRVTALQPVVTWLFLFSDEQQFNVTAQDRTPPGFPAPGWKGSHMGHRQVSESPAAHNRRRSRLRSAASGIGAALLVVGLATAVAPSAQALTNGLAKAPQMGWNDWNAFGCNVTAALVEQTADKMAANGMQKAGYNYVNVDDCWMEPQRDSAGNLAPDPVKFPGGIKAVADYVHAKGFKFGIYEDAGTQTCAGYPGSLGHEKQDANSFASWGVDYLKYDNCNNAGSSTTQQYIDRYSAMRDALAATGRPILYSLCEWGVNQPWTWGPQVGNSWRTTGDIGDSYSSMLSIFQQNVWLYPYSGAGAWNDPDMLEVGNGGQTTTEYQSEFSLWAAMNAPLLAGTDVRSMSAADLAVYTNSEVIAVDQDPLGKQAVPVPVGGKPAGDNGLWVLSKPLANGDKAVVLFNSTGTTSTISATAAEAGLPKAGDYQLRDLWAHSTTETAGRITATVPAHGTVMYRVSTKVGNSVGPNVSLTESGLGNIATGKPTSVTASFTNDGKTAVRQADLALKAPAGWTVTATGTTRFTNVGTGATVKASFTVTALSPKAPIETDTVTATANYSWRDQHGTVSTGQQAQLVSPLQAPYLSYSSATDAPALYGQIGSDLAISGAGQDVWSGNDNYSAIYQPGVVGTAATVQTQVTSAALSGYAKAGIMVRDSVTAAGTGPEGVILYVSPAGGIQLEWNSDGNAFIDSVTPGNGTIPFAVPVYLKLVRSGASYTGYYSTDNTNWSTVGTATVPGQAATQDAGLFVVSASSGSPALVGFHELTVS